MILTDNVIGHFKIRNAERGTYKLDSIVDSPYETELDGDDHFRRKLNSFTFPETPFNFESEGREDLVETLGMWLFDFKKDFTATLRTDWDKVELTYDETDVDGVRKITFYKDDEEWEFNWYSPIASFMRTIYPSTYINS